MLFASTWANARLQKQVADWGPILSLVPFEGTFQLIGSIRPLHWARTDGPEGMASHTSPTLSNTGLF